MRGFEFLSDFRQLPEKSLDKGSLLRIGSVAIAVIGPLANQVNTLLDGFKPVNMALVQFLQTIKEILHVDL